LYMLDAAVGIGDAVEMDVEVAVSMRVDMVGGEWKEEAERAAVAVARRLVCMESGKKRGGLWNSGSINCGTGGTVGMTEAAAWLSAQDGSGNWSCVPWRSQLAGREEAR
jgi:N-acetylglutamate synthase/N-acetylornithine aminotransferase